MNDEQLKAELLKILKMTHVSKQEQDTALYHVISIAQRKLKLAIPEMLNDEQLDTVEAMQQAGKPDSEVFAWIKSQLPNYDEMFTAVMLDVAEEAAGVQ